MKKILLLLVAAILYFGFSELSAKRKAEQFCDSVSIGESASGLREAGIASGARRGATNWHQAGSSMQELWVTYTGFFPGSDFICQIRERGGAVVAKNPYIVTSLLN